MWKSSISSTQRSTYSQILYCVLERWMNTHNRIMHGKTSWCGSKVLQFSWLWTELMMIQWSSSGIFSQDSPHCSFATKSRSYCQDWAKYQKILQDGSFSCRCSMTSYGDLRTTKNAKQMVKSFLSTQRNSEQDNGHLSDLDLRKGAISEDSPQGEWDRTAEKIMLIFGESGHPIFRATRPLSRGVLKSKGKGKLSIHYFADHETIETVLRTIISVNQLSLYGTVAEMCENGETYWKENLILRLCQV